MNKVRPVSFLKWLRFHTTFFLHMKAHKNSWYREWHQWRFSHHFHTAMLIFYLISVFLGSLGAFLIVAPKNTLASTSFTWDLNTPSEYTYNPEEVQFVDGVVQPERDHFVVEQLIFDTYSIDANTAYFVTSYGKILKTNNGGTDFTFQDSGTSNDLQSIFCIDANNCYTVGGNGFGSNSILKTTNGGTNWSAQTSGITNNLYDVYFTDTNTGYVVGANGKILKTTNGGANWNAQTSGITNYLYGIHCTNADTCYTVGNSGKILKTTNGGANWNAQTSGTTSDLQEIYCTDINTCYIVGGTWNSATILKTTNGGTNWNAQTSGITNYLYGIHCTDANTCYVVGGYGGNSSSIIKTTNGGTNWSVQTSGAATTLRNISCTDANTCYAVGGYTIGGEAGPILKTINGGSEWTMFNYYPEHPTVTANASQDYSVITEFTETLGAGSTGYVRYQVSNDNGATWYYYYEDWENPANNGWQIAPYDFWGSATSDINTHIPEFDGNFGNGTGKFKWRAIFWNGGEEQPKLDNVQITVADPPNVPRSLTISDVSNREKEVWALALSWDLPEPGGTAIDFYKIERSDNGGPWHETGRTSDGTKRAYAEVVDSSGVTYSYRIRAVDHDDVGDLYDNESEPSNVVSMVPTGKYPSPPSLLGTPSVSVSATTTNITWSTDRVSSSAVKYGTDTGYGLIASDNQTSVTSHSVLLKGLLPGTTYHYKIQSLDPERTYGDDVYYSTDYIFTTTLAAEISNLKITGIRSDSALLSWQTTSDMASTVHYGKTAEYGSNVAASAGTNHSIRLTGLESSATYHFKIIGNDAGGNLVQSDDYSFETLAFPKISNVKFEPVKDKPTSTLKVIWDTNVPASSIVEYADNTGTKQSASDYQLLTEHEIIISGLKDKTDYLMTVKGRDGLGNEVSSEGHKVTTELDTRAPEISEITTETSIDGYGSGAKAQLIVSWTTDEPATSQVEHSKGASGKKLDLTTQEDTSLTTSHAVVISDLKPSTPYYFKIVTNDKSKNEAKSEVKSALTGQALLSIFDIVLKSFESTLGWLFGAEGLK